MALELRQRGMEVTVVDRRSSPVTSAGASAGDGGERVCADATSGSWAWLNANGKSRLSQPYAALSRLAMLCWRRVPPWCDLAVWSGSLVASDNAAAEDDGGAYAVEADLKLDRVTDIEPLLLPLREKRHYHFYPDEGSAEPVEALQAAIDAAAAAGVRFVWDASVESLIRDQPDERACGVQLRPMPGGTGAECPPPQ